MKIPSTPLELGLDGFSEWREHQREAVQLIVDAFEDYDHVLVDAPTGAGKTIIGAGAAKALGRNARALYLAHTIVLQKQQLRTLPGAVTATGRNNHACLKDNSLAASLLSTFRDQEGLTAEDASDLELCPCEFASPSGCGYYKQWFDVHNASDAVLNYAYAVRVARVEAITVAENMGFHGEKLNKVFNPFTGRDLMICDEGHNLERALLDADMVQAYRSSFEHFQIALPTSTEYEVWLEWAQDTHDTVLNIRDAMGRARLAGLSLQQQQNLLRDRRRIRSVINCVEGIIDLQLAGQVYVKETDYGFQIQPIWIWSRAHQLLFQYANKTMIMSATLGQHDLAAKLLGLGDNWTSVTIPSTFPVENRPVVYWPVSKMTYTTPDSEKARQGLALAYLANVYPDEPGVVHCNSYALGRMLAEVVAREDPATARRLIMHDSRGREATHAEFERNPGNKILITPAATTGVDWDFLGWQMIPKIPYPDLSDPITKLRQQYVDPDTGEKLGQKVYLQEAIKTLVQASGRAVRTPVSNGTTIVTDEAFWSLLGRADDGAFPEWFKEAVNKLNNEPELESGMFR